LHLVIIGVVAQCLLVLTNSSVYPTYNFGTASWLVTLFAAGLLMVLALPGLLAGLAALGIMALWVVVRQVVDQWGVAHLAHLSLEIILLDLTFLAALSYRRESHTLRRTLTSLEALNDKLGLTQVEADLLPYAVGELRLTEEIERAAWFGRPLALLVVDLNSCTSPVPAEQIAALRRAAYRQIRTHVGLHDIPFQIDAHRVGVILPERDWMGAMEALYHLEEALLRAGETHRVSRSVDDVLDIHIRMGVLGDTRQTAREMIEDAHELVQPPALAWVMPARPPAVQRLSASA
jgi:hypothetical protein